MRNPKNRRQFNIREFQEKNIKIKKTKISHRWSRGESLMRFRVPQRARHPRYSHRSNADGTGWGVRVFFATRKVYFGIIPIHFGGRGAGEPSSRSIPHLDGGCCAARGTGREGGLQMRLVAVCLGRYTHTQACALAAGWLVACRRRLSSADNATSTGSRHG